MAIVQYLPSKVSESMPPKRLKRKETPPHRETIDDELALDKCIVPVRYVTRLTPIDIVDNLSHSSTTAKLLNSHTYIRFIHIILATMIAKP